MGLSVGINKDFTKKYIKIRYLLLFIGGESCSGTQLSHRLPEISSSALLVDGMSDDTSALRLPLPMKPRNGNS